MHCWLLFVLCFPISFTSSNYNSMWSTFIHQFPSWTWTFLWSNVKCVCCERSENTWWEIVWHYVSWPCVVLNYWQALLNFWRGKFSFVWMQVITNGVCPHLLWCFIMFKMTASWIECSSIVRQSIQDLSYPLFTVTLTCYEYKCFINIL